MAAIQHLTEQEIFERLKTVQIAGQTCRFSEEKCAEMAPLVNEILELKREKDAVLLAHSYVTPEILYTVADHVGDSYKLSKDALESENQLIVFSAVKFMAETAKILNPDKRVLVPSKINGCSLADSVTEVEMKHLRSEYADYAFICYINTTAEVKAYCDVCVTSSNVYDIVERYPNDKIVFLPDKLMGENVKKELKRRGVNKEIVIYEGTCYVHESYDPEVIDFLKLQNEQLEVVVHPECSPEITERASYVGSTSQMLKYIKESDKNDFFVLTECGLIDRLQVESSQKNFIGSCTMCRYMKSNTLEDIKRVLTNPDPEDEILLEKEVIEKAKVSLDNMFKYAN